LVIGGTAAILHGVPRATFDLDILIEATTENARRLLEGLLEAGFATASLTSPEDILSHEITIFKDRYRIDVQTFTPGLEFGSAWSRREQISFDNVPIPILCKSDLIASKRASGRPVDLEDVRLLEENSKAS
jgi:hypothetical protein